MKRNRSRLIIRHCPRCDKKVSGLANPIFGSTQLHEKLSGICSNCVTEDERRQIMNDQCSGILGRKVEVLYQNEN